MTALAIREASEADAPGIRRLFARTFGVEQTEQEWLWKYARNPDGWYGIVAEQDGEIVGNYAGWGMRFLVDGEETVLYSVGDVATDPRARGLGRAAYRAMSGAFYETMDARGVPFCFGFPNARALEISNRLVGTRTFFAVREVRLPVAAFPAPRSPANAILAADAASAGFDLLWAAARTGISHGAVRDRLRANWRFHARPTRYYRMLSIEGAGGARSWAALSVVGEKALVADFLDADPEGGGFPELFAAAAAEAARLGARYLVFWETPGGPGREAIGRLPGERREAGFSFAVRSLDDAAGARLKERAHFVPALYDVV